ncbi:uncharacterized protein [Apostichopus japonicus]|uniref:uncharacterized protein n=1 Tax=Stichopus japonicus TaxID=307972 RepID=UPI003AB486FE
MEAADTHNTEAEKVNAEDCWFIQSRNIRRIRRFNAEASEFVVIFKKKAVETFVQQQSTILTAFYDIFDSLIRNIMDTFQTGDLVGMEFDHVNLHKTIFVPLMRRDQIDADRILSILERILQSNDAFTLDDTLRVKLIRVKETKGGQPSPLTLSEWRRKKQSIVRIGNDDDMCLARAIVTAMSHSTKQQGKKTDWSNIRKGRSKQTKLAEQLHLRAGIPIGSCGLDAIPQFETVYSDYRIIVLTTGQKNPILYAGQNVQGKPLFLYYHHQHFDTIVSVAGFLNSKFFCIKCLKTYTHRNKHACTKRCLACKTEGADCQTDGQRWYCESCHHTFKNQTCLSNHLICPIGKRGRPENSTCMSYKRCGTCFRSYNPRETHECGIEYCSKCQKRQPCDHLCYMQPLLSDDADGTKEDDDQQKNLKRMIFFYFESRIEADGQHVPNLCVAQVVCDQCLTEEDIDIPCEECGLKRQWTFHSVETFCQWACQQPNALFIAHNLKGYDGQFILDHMSKSGMPPSQLVTMGTKIAYMEFTLIRTSRNEKRETIKFKDSYNFIPMALSRFSKTFGLEETKGYFPYLFNTSVHETYEGPWPAAHYYHPEVMSAEKQKSFYAWYETQKHSTFNMAEEMKKYCIDDVNLLRKGCLRFRRDFLAMNQMDPFVNAMTIAQACQQVFRRKFLKEDTIALVPSLGYRRMDTHSKKATQWLAWQGHVAGVRIQHARNGGETTVKCWQDNDTVLAEYKVDGFQNDTVYEFHGCVWHGCPRCYPDRTKQVPGSSFTMADAFIKTQTKMNHLRKQFKNVVKMWECDFDRLLKTDTTMKAFVNTLTFREALHPRRAFFGGRTNATVLRYDAKEGEQIKYIDVCSLYPFVNKFGIFPIGHPTIVTENFDGWETYHGLMYCRVVPPRKLYHPVLPYRTGNKLLFPLCRKCADEKQQSLCLHDDNDRALEGTWVTLELEKAVEKGYRIVEIFEVWHFDEFAQYNTEKKEGGLFADYINTFLKMKQEADGWPTSCDTEDKRKEYVEAYAAREGVRLEHVEKNEDVGVWQS